MCLILFLSRCVGCYKFGDPLLVEEGEDSLDEEGGRGEGVGGRGDDDSDDQFADDEAASNQGDSSSQEYLEDHYAGEECFLEHRMCNICLSNIQSKQCIPSHVRFR